MHPALTKEAPSVLADHLIGIPGAEWTFWRWVCLRSAGFPAQNILKVAAPPELISAADSVLETIQAMERAQEKALQQVNLALDELRSKGQWDDKKTRKALLDARVKIKQNEVPRAVADAVQLDSITEFQTAILEVEAARACFLEKFSNASEQLSVIIREIAGLDDFREAVTWQNRAAVRTALDLLVRKPLNGSSRSSRQKQHEELVASYWQRYCIKNDTIGFFGPVGWARLAPEIEYLETRPGEQLITARKMYCESWAMEALAAAIARKQNLQRWIPPIVMPFIRVGNTVLYHPVFGPTRITPKQVALLRACDGRDTGKEIAEKILLLPGKYFRAEAEVYEMLGEFANKRFISWAFNIPSGPHPERVTRAALERIDDSDTRQAAIGLLDEFESARACVEASAGNADKLALAFDNLEQVFTRITDLPATRGQGQVYAGRTLVYEDCRRDVEVLLGPELLKSLAGPLSLLLVSARWLTARFADVYKKKWAEIFAELARSTGNSSVVEAGLFWGKVMPLFFEGSTALIAPVQEEFRGKWERILQLGPDRAPVCYASDQLRQQIMEEFPGSQPGWIAARYHSPDIMIAASSAEAVRRGDYLLVMGEVHVSKNTLEASLFVNQHPSPEDLLHAVEQDLQGLNVMPIGLKIMQQGCRTNPSLVPDSYFRLEYLPDAFTADRSRALPLSALVIENHNGELVAATRDGRSCWNWIDLVGQLLSLLVVDSFKIMAPRPHTPRISIDRLVIKREAWRFSASDIKFAQCSSPAERFLQARIWAREQGIPRFAFFKVPVEDKPAYVDFESPILVDIFARMVRRSAEGGPESSIDVSEMLPTINQLWLTDSHNQLYTSELRFVAVDSAQSPQCT